MSIQKPVLVDGYFKQLFYEKLLLYSSDGWNNSIPLKEVNRKFSLLFLTKKQTFTILKILERDGLLEIKGHKVVVRND